jgi:hypothetical protein
LENPEIAKSPQTLERRIRRLNHGILAILILVIFTSGICPISATVLDEHIIGRTTGIAHQIEPTFVLVRDDMVASKVSLSATEEGDLLEWTFSGPQGRTYTDSHILSSGQDWAQTELDLSLLPSEDVIGTWTLDLSLNGVQQEQQTFTVEPLTGLVWWGPFVGLGVLLVVVLVVGVLVIGGIVVLIGVLRRKKEG